MKSDRCLKNKLMQKMGKNFIFPIMVVFSLTFIMGFYYEPNIYVKLNDVTVELGDELPEEITKYKNLLTDNSTNLTIETSVPLDEEGHTNVIGKFAYYLVYNDDLYKLSRLTNVKSTITVIDTIKPIIKIKDDVKIKYDSDFAIDDIAECYDLSECTLVTIEDIDTTKSGEYEITIVATDEAQNENTAKTKITILEKPKPVYTYASYNSNFDQMNNKIKEKNTSLSEEEKNSLRENVASFAKQFIGNPYVYGGTSLTNGADCSGFTMSIYAHFGYAIPRGSFDQAYIGIPVAESELLPGDLVVYYGHVGIYTGNGMMMHASTPQGGIVHAPVYAGYKVYRRIVY